MSMEKSAKEDLRGFVERIERLEEEKAVLASDIRQVYAEAKSHGFDAKVLRRVVTLRRQDAVERREFEALLDVYLHALGMLFDTPLGEAAVARAKVAKPGHENRGRELVKAMESFGTPGELTE